MGKTIQGKQVKGKWIEEEVDDPSCLYESDVIKIIGQENLKAFKKWMAGQGAPIMSDSTCGYFSWDVEKFKRHYIDGVPQMMRSDIEEIFKQMDKDKDKKEYIAPVKKKGKR